MKLKHYHFEPFSWPLKDELVISNHTLKTREGYWMTAVSDEESNLSFYAEICPLPGLHDCTPEEVVNDIKLILPKLKLKELNINQLDMHSPYFQLWELPQQRPYVQWVLESLLLDYLIKNQKIPVKQVSSVTSNHLVYLDHKESWKKIKPSEVVKFKAARSKMKWEIEAINILSQTHDNLQWRIDANQAWDADEFDFFSKNIPIESVDYFEEPLKNLNAYAKVKTTFPLALDENLLTCLKKDFFPKQTTTWILKPSLYGGLSSCLNLIDLAHKSNFHCVISSCFETPYYRAPLNFLAHYQNNKKNTIHGLNTETFFQSRPDEYSQTTEVHHI